MAKRLALTRVSRLSPWSHVQLLEDTLGVRLFPLRGNLGDGAVDLDAADCDLFTPWVKFPGSPSV